MRPLIGVTTAEISGPEPRRRSAGFLLRALRELGYVYGSDFVTEARGAEGKPLPVTRLAPAARARRPNRRSP